MVRSGFWNSLGTDIRTYYNTDFSHLMSLMIKDGIHQNYGEHLVVLPGTGLQVIVQTGECWFNECWVRNDADLQVSINNAPIVAGYKRIDAIAIKIDATNAVRNGTIEYVAGEPGSSPVAPTLTDTDEIHWHLLAYVTVNANATSISASNIENKIGTTGTPFITGILETVDITTLLGQWSSQFNDWMDENNTEFQTWFQHMKDQLDEDAAGHLQNEIDGITGDIDTINDRLDNLDLSATSVSYNDTTTQLGATNVQTAIEKLKTAFSSALTSLKATPIAQAVGATGNTFAAVIQKLNAIVVRKNSPSTRWQNASGRPVTDISLGARGGCSDGTVRSVFEIPSGYYTYATDLVGVTDAKMKQLGWLIPSGNKAITANGSYDVKANATVSVNVDTNTNFGKLNILTNPQSGWDIVQAYGGSWSGQYIAFSGARSGIVIQNNSGVARAIAVVCSSSNGQTFQWGRANSAASLPSIIDSGAGRIHADSAQWSCGGGAVVNPGERFFFAIQANTTWSLYAVYLL